MNELDEQNVTAVFEIARSVVVARNNQVNLEPNKREYVIRCFKERNIKLKDDLACAAVQNVYDQVMQDGWTQVEIMKLMVIGTVLDLVSKGWAHSFWDELAREEFKGKTGFSIYVQFCFQLTRNSNE